ncbi:MAG: anthranilate synthase component I family protein [Nitrospiria bacterium]
MSCFKKIFHSPPAFLFESARENPITGRYSFLGSDPYLTLEARQNEVVVRKKGKFAEILKSDPFSCLKPILDRFDLSRPPGLPPFFGGAVGFFSYDLCRYFERLPLQPRDGIGFPDFFLLFVDTVIVFDHMEKTGKVIYFPSPEDLSEKEWKSLEKTGKEKVSRYFENLESPLPIPPVPFIFRPLSIFPADLKKAFQEKVLKCKEYIRAGEIFQANLSQRFTVSPINTSPLSLYEMLREINPSPFSSFLDAGEFQIVSSSPERLVSLSQGRLNTRPIAGTRPRGRDPLEDAKLASDLMANEKERAEHMMLVDLERNDLGKVCEFGSVDVDDFMGLEYYSHVIHIVSNITGQLKKGKGWYDIIKAVFPGGTISGVPKIRAMEIIDELETVSRGPYTGSLGYISFSGELDLNILIRTLFLKNGNGYIQTGAGIVADSDPEKEYEETIQKAHALFKAMETPA